MFKDLFSQLDFKFFFKAVIMSYTFLVPHNFHLSLLQP